MKAFTTLELIVAMILTGVIASLSYEAWLLLGQHGKKRSESSENIHALAVANYLLKRDASLCDTAEVDLNTIRFYQKSNITEYVVDDSTLVRSCQGQVDQFHIGVASLQGSFDSIPIESGIVSSLEMTIRIGKDLQTFSYPIYYPAAIRLAIQPFNAR